jgi:hypothetical protein
MVTPITQKALSTRKPSFPAQSSMCVGGSAKPRSHGCWSGPIKSQRLSGTRKELAKLYPKWGAATQRCQVPSGWTGPSHLLLTGPPYWQPALAGGADAISSPVILRQVVPGGEHDRQPLVRPLRPVRQLPALPNLRLVMVRRMRCPHQRGILFRLRLRPNPMEGTRPHRLRLRNGRHPVP